jgi:transposase
MPCSLHDLLRIPSVSPRAHGRFAPQPCELDPWLDRAARSLVAAFANGINKDRDAVHAAIVSAWSNGQTEGQICKLKLVKRQMYGRGKIDLLEARVIGMN